MTERIGAVILAAGAGTRLGGVAKALLVTPAKRSFLASIVETARAAGLGHAVIVVGPPHGDEVAAHAKELGLLVITNDHPERGMSSSVALGFAAISETDCDAAWLWPVDHPNVTVATLQSLIAALDTHDAARPVVGARGGHPPLVARSIWPQLAVSGDVPGGARMVLGEADMIDVDVEDEGCVRDIDTVADLEAL
ncbi:MAG: hypothetical protein JWO36_3516 [Myxococcales bacterium]|nr:hypothetical protein [Myxococcales bacterium]